MGNQASSHNSSAVTHAPDLRDWKAIGEGQNYQIWRNNLTHEELEEYIFTATDGKQFAMMKRVFQFRYEKDFIVASRYFREENNSEICSTFYQGHTFMERIPLRLNEIKDLPFPDSLHLLSSCLKGFKELYTKIGSFDVNDHMIGINSEAKVKVWLNADFGKGRNEDSINARREDERKMVSQIISLVDKVIDHRTEPESLTQFVSKNFPPNFEEALSRLEQYLVRHQTSIPPYLISIALLRDRGYFKKMTPRLGASVDGARLTEMRMAREQEQMRNIGLNLGSSAREAFIGGRLSQEMAPINQNVPAPVLPQIGLPPFPVERVSIQPITTVPQPIVVQSPFAQSNLPLNAQLTNTAINHQNLINTTSVVTPVQTPVPFRFPHKTQVSAHQGVFSPQTIPALVSIPNQIELKLTKVTSPIPENDYRTGDNQGRIGLSHHHHLQFQKQEHQQINQYPIQHHRQIQSQPLTQQQRNQIYQQQSTTISPINTNYPSETGSALDKILQRTQQIGSISQQTSFSHPSQVTQPFTIFNTLSNNKIATLDEKLGWKQSEGYTNPQLLRLNVKDYSSNQTYPSSQSSPYSYNRTEGGTDPSLLSKACSGILNLIDKKPQSSYQPYSSSQPLSFQPRHSEGTHPDLLSKMTDFKSSNDVNRRSTESNFTFVGGKQANDNQILTTLLVGGIIAAPDYKLKQLVGSGPDIMNIVKQSKKGVTFANTGSFETAKFGGSSIDSKY